MSTGGVLCTEHEIVEIRDVVDTLFPTNDILVEDALSDEVSIAFVVGCLQELPDIHPLSTKVVFHCDFENAHVTPPERHRP